MNDQRQRENEPHSSSVAAPVRVVIQQPGLAKYRVPVFRELARRPGIRLRVVYGQGGEGGKVPNVKPDGFEGIMVRRRALPIGGRELLWSPPQWTYASPVSYRRPNEDAAPAPSVLILSWNLQYISLVPSLLRARYHGLPTILWGHGYSKQEHALRRWPRENVARLATALMFYNHRTAEHYIANGWDAQRVFVALNALDQSPIQATRDAWLAQPQRLQDFRTENGLDGPVTLFVSRLEVGNRVDLLLRAAALIHQSNPKHQVVIIGTGSEGQSLRRLAERLGIAHRVRFLGAIYDAMNLAPWFLCADAFCYPASIGLSLLHAFGYGLPVVTGDAIESQNPEIEALEHEGNGLLFRDGDPRSLADALRRLFDDSDLRQRLSAAAHRTATERFTLANMVDGMEAAVKWCAAQSAQK